MVDGPRSDGLNGNNGNGTSSHRIRTRWSQGTGRRDPNRGVSIPLCWSLKKLCQFLGTDPMAELLRDPG
ncbi:Hypothetical predicted protein [Paramuricea clavata]|nr:Hypothetical predicted protein [Paramuricea clavata]